MSDHKILDIGLIVGGIVLGLSFLTFAVYTTVSRHNRAVKAQLAICSLAEQQHNALVIRLYNC